MTRPSETVGTKGREPIEAVLFPILNIVFLCSDSSYVKRLAKMKTMTETIQSNGGKVLEEVRKMTTCLDEQVETLRESVAALKLNDGGRRQSTQSRFRIRVSMIFTIASVSCPQ
jgi:hypothetical protein